MADDESQKSPLPPGARRDSKFFLLLFGATVVLYLLSLPMIFGVILTGPAAAFFGVRSLWRSRSVSGVLLFRYTMVAGIAASLLAGLTGLAMIVFHEPVSALRDCSARAITQTAQDQCQRDYEEGLSTAVEDMLERFGISSD